MNEVKTKFRKLLKEKNIKLSLKEFNAIWKVLQEALKDEKPEGKQMYWEELQKLDQLPQTQASLQFQMFLLRPFANKLGLYDAADYLKPKE